MTAGKLVAIITGGASGIGLALGRLLAERRFHVVLADVDDAAIVRAATQFTASNTVETIRLDVTDPQAVQALVLQVVGRCGRLDYLFNNAGVGGTLDVRQATLAHWDRIIDLNLLGVIHGVQAAYPIMVSQGYGHIVNTSSISGLLPWPGQTLYNTTKYAIVGLSHTLRAEAARFGVKVSVVCPGPVKSAIWGMPIIGDHTGKAAPDDAMTAEDAAAEIWLGIEKNRATIIFPRQSRLAVRLYRLSPRLLRSQFTAQLKALLPE